MIKNKNIVKVFPHNFPIGENQNVSIWSVSKTYINHSKFCEKFLVLSAQADYSNETSYYKDNIEIDYILPCEEVMLKNNIILQKDTPIENWNLSNKKIDRIYYLKEVIKKIEIIKPKLIEVENDVRLAGSLAKTFRNKIPVIFIPHVVIAKKNLLSNIRLYLHYIRFIKKIIFVSNAHYTHFYKKFFFSRIPSVIIHNSYAHIQPSNRVINTKINQIIFAGRGSTIKGYKDYILGVLPILSKYPEWKALAVLSIETTYSKEKVTNFLSHPDIQKASKKKQLEIIFNLPNNQLFKKLEESKIAIFPTHSNWIEGLPLVGIEAHLAKCALISSPNPGFKELSGINAIYLDKIDCSDISHKLEFLITNPKLRERLAISGYLHLIKNFSVDQLIKKYDTIRNKYLS